MSIYGNIEIINLKSNERWILFDFLVGKMPILRGLRALKIDDCRKHRKNQEKPQKHPRRIGIY